MPGLRGGDWLHNGMNGGALTNWHCVSRRPERILAAAKGGSARNFLSWLDERGRRPREVAPVYFCLLFRVWQLVVLCCIPLTAHPSFAIFCRFLYERIFDTPSARGTLFRKYEYT